jgi:hypothetical protein
VKNYLINNLNNKAILWIAGIFSIAIILCVISFKSSHEREMDHDERPRLATRRQLDVKFEHSFEQNSPPEDPYRIVVKLLEMSKAGHVDAALELATKLPLQERENALFYLLMGLVNDEPATVSNWVLSSGLPDHKIELILRELVGSWKPHDSYLNWAEINVSGDRLNNLKGLILREIARKSPEEALLRVSTIQAGTNRSKFLAMVVAGWADADLNSAKEYVLENLKGEEFGVAMAEIFPRWIESDLDTAKAYLMENPDSIMKSFVPLVVYATIDKDPGKTLSWAVGLPANLREEGVRPGIFRWVNISPNSAVKYVEELAGETKIVASCALGAAWSDIDPEAAANWASRQSDDLLAGEITKEVLFRWSRNSPLAAVEWTLEMPESITKRETILFLEKVANSNNDYIPPGFEEYSERLFNDKKFQVAKRFCIQCNKIHQQ